MTFEIEEEPPATFPVPSAPCQGSTVPGQPHSAAASFCSKEWLSTQLNHSSSVQRHFPPALSFPSSALPHHWVKNTQEIQHMGRDGANQPPLASFPLGLGCLKWKVVWDVIAFPWGVIPTPSLQLQSSLTAQNWTWGLQGQLYKP